MKRVQVYLEPENVYLLDRIAHKLNISRSQVIRSAVCDAVAKKYTDKAGYTHPKEEKNALLEMAGIEESKIGDLGLRVDEIYNSI
jgi:metal-responsive CopG/Arc/MetJ family transcriptional regulator